MVEQAAQALLEEGSWLPFRAAHLARTVDEARSHARVGSMMCTGLDGRTGVYLAARYPAIEFVFCETDSKRLDLCRALGEQLALRSRMLRLDGDLYESTWQVADRI